MMELLTKAMEWDHLNARMRHLDKMKPTILLGLYERNAWMQIRSFLYDQGNFACTKNTSNHIDRMQMRIKRNKL